MVMKINRAMKGLKAMKAKPATKTSEEKQFEHVSQREEDLMKKWHKEGLGFDEIAGRLTRSTDTVSRHVFKKNTVKAQVPKGRPVAISKKMWPKIWKKYNDLLAKAQAKTDVTAKMVRNAAHLKCSVKAVSRAFWKRGIYFRPLYEKPTLEKEDRQKRRDFADKHQSKTAQAWAKYPHAVIDNKVFQVYPKGSDRDFAARRRCRGAYRPRQRIYINRTKPGPSLKRNTGAKSAIITCAIGGGRVLVWHENKSPWNATEAAAMYSGPLLKALKKRFPLAKRYNILEDNDPTGYKSSKAKDAKKAAGMVPIELPPRSPDLNPLDFSLWAEVNRRMRAQEKKFAPSKRETRQTYLKRLRRTAMNLPESYINNIMGHAMAKRCQLLAQAKGGHFAEGGN